MAKNEVITTVLQGGNEERARFELMYLKENKIHEQEGREGS